MTCHHTTKPHSSGTTPIDILTYRYDKKLVYVPVAPDYIVSPALRSTISEADKR